jgi:hypothetical protein
MALIILVSDRSVGTLLKVGLLRGQTTASGGWIIADTTVQSSLQIQAWKSPGATFQFLEKLTRLNETVPLFDTGFGATFSKQDVAPMSSRQGNCVYDTGSLFCFDGPQSGNSVALVLWQFAVQPKPGDSGNGRLMLGGAMTVGDIYWEIIFPPDPNSPVPTLGSWSGSTAISLLKRKP